jgi:hypothetical protein
MRNLSYSGRATDPETSNPKLDSRKTAMLTPAVRRPTERRDRARPRRSTPCTNPCIPPDAWVRVIMEPMSTLNMSTRALSAAVMAAT